jgi:predicted GNAT family acetyltransferase
VSENEAVSSEPEVSVVDEPEAQRYEARLGGELAGFVAYRAQPGQIALNHTEVGDRFEGQGVGSRLASFALDDARRRGLAVLPFCPFVSSYIQRHPEYVELVPAARRAGFGL